MVLDLLHSLYDSSILLPQEEAFYKKAVEDIEYFHISPQIYIELKQGNKLATTPVFFQERLKNQYDKALFQNLFIRNQLILILKQLDSLRIEVIPLKGVLFAERFFGHLGARWTSDIDLLIRQSDVQEASKAIKLLGFTIEEDGDPEHFHITLSKSLPHTQTRLSVELHWNILREDTSKLDILEFWEHAEPLPGYQFAKRLSDYHEFYMACLHSWRHNLGSLKYFLDIIQTLKLISNRLDYQLLFEDARRHQTFKRIRRTLNIVYSHFPELNKIKKLPDQYYSKHLAWRYEHIRRQEDKSLLKYIFYYQFLFLNFDTARHSLIAIWKWLLPSQGGMVYQLKEISNKSHPLFNQYFILYQKRFRNLARSFINIIRKKKT